MPCIRLCPKLYSFFIRVHNVLAASNGSFVVSANFDGVFVAVSKRQKLKSQGKITFACVSSVEVYNVYVPSDYGLCDQGWQYLTTKFDEFDFDI